MKSEPDEDVTKSTNESEEASGTDQLDNSSPPSKKRKLVEFTPVRLPAISTVCELEQQTLVFQNRKLTERLRQRQRTEDALRKRVEQLEQRQTQDDALICIINRHWNRLDEDVRVLLQRFDAEAALESETTSESKATVSFLAMLGQLSKQEVDDRLLQRVEFTRRAIGKLVQAFDHITQRNEKLGELIHELRGGDETEADQTEQRDQPQRVNRVSESILSVNAEVTEQNRQLQDLVTKLQQRDHEVGMLMSKAEDKSAILELRFGELKSQLEEARYDLQKAHKFGDKLEFRLAEMNEELQAVKPKMEEPQTTEEETEVETETVTKKRLNELSFEAEELRELAQKRLQEAEEYSTQLQQEKSKIEELSLRLNHVPDNVVKESFEYKKLQAQFSVLLHESAQIRSQLDEVRKQLDTARFEHWRQIEQMEKEELEAQNHLRREMLTLEEQLNTARREYEMLRVEWQQNLAANEQTGPLNKEMRQLLSSFKAQNAQLKTEVSRFKKKYKECVSIIAQLERDCEEARKTAGGVKQGDAQEPEVVTLDSESGKSTDAAPADCSQKSPKDKYDLLKTFSVEEGEIASDVDTDSETDVAKLRGKIYRLQSEMKTLGDSDLVKKIKTENDKLKFQMHSMKGNSYEDLKKRIKQFEIQVAQQKKMLDNGKSEEEVLLNEMEVTGQAFEDMQEQNVRVLQQLREKDDANFKLMSERIRANQQHKILIEEKQLISEQVEALQNQVEAQNLVVRRLEEKERLLQTNVATLEKDVNLRQQAVGLHRRKAIETAQASSDLNLQLNKVQSQLLEAQTAVSEKAESLEASSFKLSRLKEDNSVLRKRVERSKKLEKASDRYEIYEEEIRELKEQLTCPSCKVRRKDGMLVKCNHVFCMECLRSRYETRQRKCPKCNAAFGANDFMRIYIS